MSTRIRKSAAERKSEIVETVLLMAAKVGPDRLSTEALAAAVGISQPGIFRHFPKKSDIWQAVAERIAEMLKENGAVMENRDMDSADRMKSFVTGHLTFLQTTPAIPAILFSRELHAENEVLRSFFAGLMQRVHRFVSDIIAGEIKAGRYQDSINPDEAAFLILALIQGTAMRWSLNERQFDLVEEGQRLLDLQLRGFKTRD